MRPKSLSPINIDFRVFKFESLNDFFWGGISLVWSTKNFKVEVIEQIYVAVCGDMKKFEGIYTNYF